MKLRLFILFAFLAAALSACNFSLAEDITPPPNYQPPTPAPTQGAVFPASVPNLTSGKAIYTEKCAACHGDTGLGDGPQAANLPGKVTALASPELASAASPAQWFEIVSKGRMDKFMPPFTSLSEQERWDVVGYALALSMPVEKLQAGKALFEIHCAQCHGADGQQVTTASLTSQQLMANLSLNDLVILIQKGVPPSMPATALGNADSAALAAYVRTFEFTGSSSAAAADSTPQPGEAAPGATPAVKTTPAQASGKISGMVSLNGGGTLPAGLQAVLHTFEHDTTTQQFTEGAPITTAVSAEGKYEFNNVPMTPTSAYYVSVDFNGATYESSPALPGRDNQSEYDLPITLYESTTDTSGLVASKVHILLDYSQPGKIQVVEVFVITNNGDKTVTAAQKGGAVVNISLPKGYQNLQFQDSILGERYLQTDTGFADTRSVTPGDQQYQLVFAFDMPFQADTSPLAIFGGQKFELSQAFTLKAESVSFLVPQGVTAQGNNFTDRGEQNMGTGMNFHLYDAGAIDAGQTFKATASGAPSSAGTVPGAGGSASTRNVIIGIGALGIALIVAGGVLFLRDRRQTPGESEDAETLAAPEEETSEDELLDAILALDDQFKAGNLAEEAYQQRRAALKEKLKSKLT